jgi:hypothetical protein
LLLVEDALRHEREDFDELAKEKNIRPPSEFIVTTVS